MKKIVAFISLLFITAFIFGCTPKKEEATPESIEIISSTNVFDETFNLEDLSVRVHMSDGTFYDVALEESMISSSDLVLLNQEGTHDIQVSYLALSDSFQITITATDGEDGREVELQTTTDYIQWRYVGETTWKNLIALNLLKGADGASGAAGPAGAAGKQVEFNVSTTHIQWRYTGDTAWVNLIEIASLKGADGVAATISINDEGYWVINGTATNYKATSEGGSDGTYIPSKVKVTFNLNGGAMPKDIPVEITDIPKGDAINLPIPTKDGYIFKGWFSGDGVNDGQFLSFMGVAKDLTLFAKWEIDTSPIEEFIRIPENRNYTFSTSFHNKNISESSTTEFIMTREESINEVDDLIHVHVIETEEGLLPYKNKGTYEAYLLYNTFNDTVFDYSYDESNEQWYLDYYWDYFDDYFLDEIFNSIDLSLFEKRADSLIYDYPLNEEIVEFFDDFPVEFVVDSEIYLDLEENKFVIKFELDGEIEDEQVNTIYEVSIQFTNIGTNDFTFPTAEVKSNLITYINDLSSSRLDLLYASPEARDNYDAWLAGYIADIEEIDDLNSLANYYEEYYLDIMGRDIALDLLGEAKLDAHDRLKFIYDDLCGSATTDSLAAMTLIYNKAIDDLQDITTVDAANTLFDDAAKAIRNAYIIDPDIELLELFNFKKVQHLNMMNSIYMDSTDSVKEQNQINDLYDEYWDLLKYADNLADFGAAYEAMLKAFANLDITLTDDAIDNAKLFILDQIVCDFSDITYLEDYYPNLYLLYENVLHDVLAAETLSGMMNVYIVFADELYDQYRSVIRAYLLEDLEDEIRPFMLAVDAEDKEMFVESYNLLKQKLNTLQDINNLGDEFYCFFSTLSLYKFDDFIVEREIKINWLYEELNMAKEGATDASIALMEALADEYAFDLAAAVDIDELDTIISTYNDELFELRESDPDKYVNQISLNMGWMNDWFEALFEDVNVYDLIYDIYLIEDAHVYLLENVTAAEQVLADWLVLVETLPYTVTLTKFEEVKQLILDDLDDFYDNILLESSEYLPEDFADIYQASIAALELVTDPYDFIANAGTLHLYMHITAYPVGIFN